MKVKEILRSKEYWVNRNQGLMYKALSNYFENSERGEQTRISKKLGFAKSYISQLLNGHLSFDHKESTRVELALAIGLVPLIQFVPIDEFIEDQTLQHETCLELRDDVLRPIKVEVPLGINIQNESESLELPI